MDDGVGVFGRQGRVHDRLATPLVPEGGRLVESDPSRARQGVGTTTTGGNEG